MVGVSWADSRTVDFLATGASTKQMTVIRRGEDGAQQTVTCPDIVKIYSEGMGGVDEHDAIRLHRYSIQKALRHASYCKDIFFGIADMALVNGYIIHKLQMIDKDKPVPTHADYLERLRRELLGQEKSDFESNMHAQNLLTAPTAPAPHALSKTTDVYQNKVRQYLCKVCSAYSDKQQRSFEPTYYCETCSSTFGGRVALCNKVRRTEKGNTLTCSQIWHDTWKNGSIIPPDLRRKIRFRKRKLHDVEEEEEEQ